jgi:hypothetical protein
MPPQATNAKKVAKVKKKATIEIVKGRRNFTFFPFVLELM